MLFANIVHQQPPSAAQWSSCSEFFTHVDDIFCYVQIHLLPPFQESMPVALNHVKLRKTLAISELFVGRNSILIITVVIVFMNQSGNAMNGPAKLDMRSILNKKERQIDSSLRFYHLNAKAYLKDNGISKTPKADPRLRLFDQHAIWHVMIKRRGTYHLRNAVTRKFLCFTRKGRPRMKRNLRGRRCDLAIFVVKNVYYRFQLKENRNISLGFCSNGRPFIVGRQTRKCSLRNRTKGWNLFRKCSGRLPPPCRNCKKFGIQSRHCSAQCRQAVICQPGRKKIPSINLSLLRNRSRRGRRRW